VVAVSGQCECTGGSAAAAGHRGGCEWVTPHNTWLEVNVSLQALKQCFFTAFWLYAVRSGVAPVLVKGSWSCWARAPLARCTGGCGGGPWSR
jgi:hypothetical protein